MTLPESHVSHTAKRPGIATPTRRRQSTIRTGQVFGLLLLIGVAAVWLKDHLSLAALAQHETLLRQYLSQAPFVACISAFAVYIFVTGLSLPGAAVMSLVIGWLFGFWLGLILVSFASTSGATIAFLLSRYLFREAIHQRFSSRLQTVNSALQREGAYYLFTLRLIPAVPFFVVNALMGLTTLPLRTFWWVSQLGMLPGTMAYVYAGSTVPSLATLAARGVRGIVSPQLLTAFVILGILPLVIRKLTTRLSNRGRPIPRS